MSNEKKRIREGISIIRKNLSREIIAEKSKKIIETLINLEEYRKAITIMSYVSLDIEVDTKELIKSELSNQNKKVIVPYIREGYIKASMLRNYNDLSIGEHGVLEPTNKEEYKAGIDLIIIPGVAFDKTGSRIGFGKGYYDKFLKDYDNTHKVALAFEEQIVDNVPSEEHDQKVDIIITEKRIIRCK